MSVNKDLIYKYIKPYLNPNNELTWEEFDNIFGQIFTKKFEQYEICEFIQNEFHVNMVDEKTTNEPIQESKEAQSTSFVVKIKNNTQKKVKYSNEELIRRYNENRQSSILYELIKQNNGRIKQIINEVGKKYNHNLKEEDLYQIACEGFLKGCEKFDCSHGAKLLTYVNWWIIQALRRNIENEGFVVRIPNHVWNAITKLKTLQALHPDLTIDELLKQENIKKEKYLKLKEIEKNYLSPLYLDATINNTDNVTLLDSISDNEVNVFCSKNESIGKAAEQELLREDLAEVLCTLSPRERDVLRIRFGMDDGRQRTLEEVGQLFGVTRERIRQIEAKALRKLRHPNRSKRLREYVEN